MHVPVLLGEVLEKLDPQPGDFVIDGTADGGGHAAELFKKIQPGGKLLALDLDEAVLSECRERIGRRPDAHFVVGNYADLPDILAREGLGKANGLLLDLGFSSEQLVNSGRGFSFGEASREEPLLMTYDDARVPVREILRAIPEKELADVIFEFGGERYARRIAKAIVEHRRKKRIETAGDLADIVRGVLLKNYEHGRLDPATRTFQALRILANGELENLRRALASLHDILAPGGRVAIISFHSLEDRIVKQTFRGMAKKSELEIITKKPIIAAREEVSENPRSRSAKLRVGILRI